MSGNYFSLLGVEMSLVRGFLPSEDAAGSPAAVAVVSYGYWTRAYGRDPAVIGRRVVFDEVPFTIVGVAAERFTGTNPDRIDVWLPMASTLLVRPDDRWTRNVHLKRACCVQVAARLASGNIKGSFSLPGGVRDEPNAAYEVSPGYFELLEIPVVEGRAFQPADAGTPVVVINMGSWVHGFMGS